MSAPRLVSGWAEVHVTRRFTAAAPAGGVSAWGLPLTYVVLENCIKCKYMDCVEVCPVDCFYVGENMLVIHPDECIDCGVCEPECPAEAIVPDSDDRAAAWAEANRTYSAQWPNITRKGEPPPDADEWKDKPGKAELFSAEPGKP